MISYVIFFFLAIPIFLYSKLWLIYLKVGSKNITFLFQFTGISKFIKKAIKESLDPLYYVYNKLQKSKQKSFLSYLFLTPFYCIADSKAIKDMVMNQKESFPKLRLSISLQKKAILLAGGERWAKQRKLLSTHFTYESLQQRTPIIKQIINENIFKFDEEQIKQKKPLPVLTRYELTIAVNITGEVVIRSFFSDDLSNIQYKGKTMQVAITEMVAIFGELMQDPFYIMKNSLLVFLIKQYCKIYKIGSKEKEFVEINNLVRNIANKNIEERLSVYHLNNNIFLKNPELLDQKKDFVSVYLKELLKENGNPSIKPELKITNSEIIEQFVIFFMAGTDTTGHLLAHSFVYLSLFPEMQDKILEECHQVLNEKNIQDVNNNDLKQMVYLEGFLNEVLRLKTPAAGLLLRQPHSDVKIGNLNIKKNSIVSAMFSSNFVDPAYFSDPEQLIPERWIDKRDQKNLDPFIFIPFSAGPRNCIGQHLAMIEAKLTLILLLDKYIIERNAAVPLKYNCGLFRGFENQNLVNLKKRS